MAAENPQIVEIAVEGVWTLVAENILTGLIKILKGDVVYYETYRLTGEGAPEATPVPGDADFEGAVMYYRLERIAGETVVVGPGGFGSTSPLDYYIYCQGGPGRVRIDKGS